MPDLFPGPHTYRAISLAHQPDRWAPILARLLTRFERCLIQESLAGPVCVGQSGGKGLTDPSS